MPLGDPDPITAYMGGEFTELELERIRQIVRADTISTVESYAETLTAEQRRATRYDIDLYINDIGEGVIAVSGGRDGVDYSDARERTEIRNRIALRLGLPVPIGGLFTIPVTANYGCWEE